MFQITHSQSDFNSAAPYSREDEAYRAKLLHLGRLIHKCGEKPTAELFSECVTLPPDVRDEMIRRLEDFTRLSPEMYEATGMARFNPRRLFSIEGGRR